MQRLTREVWEAWRPPPLDSAVEWVPRHVRLSDEFEDPGAYDLDKFPHVREVLDLADDPRVRVVLLPWSSRLGKTLAWASLLCFFAARRPRPMLVARENEDATNELFQTQLWPLLAGCAPLRRELPPVHRRSSSRGIRLARCRIRKGYSGAPGSLAGFPACYGFAAEISKWSQRRSTEADPVHLFLKRGWGFPYDSFFVLESTPAEKDRCRITELCDAAGVDVRRREVPCPHCGAWQVLVFGDKAPESPGLKWDKHADGRSDPRLAEETAHYRCVNGCRIEDEDRLAMLRRGKWLSEGQSVSKRGRIVGPRPEADTVALGHPVRHPFGALYSTRISGWGQLVREWFSKKHSREGRREYVNQTLGKLWDPAPVEIQPSELVRRLACDEPLRLCPAWSRFLTLGADVGGIGEELLFYWCVCAWGLHGRGQLVDYGLAWNRDAMRSVIQQASYPHADSGPELRPVQFGIDSGSFTELIYGFCRGLPGAWPLKGSSRNELDPWTRAGFPEMFRGGLQRAGLDPKFVHQKERAGAYDLLIPNTNRSQDWLEGRLQGHVTREHPDAFAIPGEAFGQVVPGVDLAHQLLGDYEESGRWAKRYKDQDFRDALRYAMVMAWHFTANGQLWPRLPPREAFIVHAPAARSEPRREGFIRRVRR